MAEKIITIRPHHIDRFVNYCHRPNLFDNPDLQKRYGEDFVEKLKFFFDSLASGGAGEGYILVRNELDTICHMCPIKKESCSEPDSLSLWNGSGQVMEELDLKEGWLYPIKEFMEKVKQSYYFQK